MIPSAEQILAGYPFVARRLDLQGPVSERAIQAAVEAARRLAEEREEDEPAAVFFAFATHRRAFAGGWRSMTTLLTANQAMAQGKVLSASRDEVDELLSAIMHRDFDFEAVRVWVAARLLPRP